MLRILDVGYELGAFGVHHRFELCRNLVRLGFHLPEPFKEFSRMELALGELGEVKVSRSAVEWPGPPQNIVAKALDMFAFERVCPRFDLHRRRFHFRFTRRDPFRVPPFPLRDDRGQLGREFTGRFVGQRLLPCFRRSSLSKLVEQGRAHEQRSELERRVPERVVNRLKRQSGLAGSAVKTGDAKPEAGIVGPLGCRTLE